MDRKTEAKLWHAASMQIQLWDTQVLLLAHDQVREGAMATVIKKELAARGVGRDGKWVGFESAQFVWATADLVHHLESLDPSCLTPEQQAAIDRYWDWYDQEF